MVNHTLVEATHTIGKPAIVATANGGTALYLQNCGVDYSSPVVFVPLLAAGLSIVWAVLNIDEKIKSRKKRK